MTTQSKDVEFLIIGAGMAGASVAAELAISHSVVLLERERQPGYHSTGRSAALFSATYGGRAVRALSRASRAFLFQPPAGFAETPLISARGALHIATEEQAEKLQRYLDQPDVAGTVVAVDRARMRELVPVLDSRFVLGGFEQDARDVDVHGLHQGYLRVARGAGATLVTDADVTGLERRGDRWVARTTAGIFSAPVLINAAGAWADTIAALAGVATVGLEPRRRTAVLVDPPQGQTIEAWPMVIDTDEQFYFKPDAGLLLLSPADETPSEPCDAQADEYDVAVAVDRFEQATGQTVRKVAHRWAGLRSFVSDRAPVVGFDEHAPGFFWLAGQGGYGIQTAPAMAATAAALVRGAGLPNWVADFGVTAPELAPGRIGR